MACIRTGRRHTFRGKTKSHCVLLYSLPYLLQKNRKEQISYENVAGKLRKSRPNMAGRPAGRIWRNYMKKKRVPDLLQPLLYATYLLSSMWKGGRSIFGNFCSVYKAMYHYAFIYIIMNL